MRDSMMAALALRMQQQEQQDQSALANAARQPIPGMTGPVTPMPTVGMAPPQQPPLPSPIQQPQPFMASGPFGQQAMRMAGLLGGAGNHMVSPPGNIQTQQGLLGAPPKGFRIPFYRPVGK